MPSQLNINQIRILKRNYNQVDNRHRKYLSRAEKNSILVPPDQHVLLDFDSFIQMTLSKCFYCGAKPSMRQRIRTDSKYELNVNGIDRIYSWYGYALSNAVPCCPRCNSAKGNSDISYFKKYLRRIYKNEAYKIRNKQNPQSIVSYGKVTS